MKQQWQHKPQHLDQNTEGSDKQQSASRMHSLRHQVHTFGSSTLEPPNHLRELCTLMYPRSSCTLSWLSEVLGMLITGASISMSSCSTDPTSWLPSGAAAEAVAACPEALLTASAFPCVAPTTLEVAKAGTPLCCICCCIGGGRNTSNTEMYCRISWTNLLRKMKSSSLSLAFTDEYGKPEGTLGLLCDSAMECVAKSTVMSEVEAPCRRSQTLRYGWPCN